MSETLTRDSIASTACSCHEDAGPSGVMWSRSAGLLSQSGAADDELKCKVSSEAGDDFRRLARSVGMTVSEFLRIMVLTRLYGVDGVTDMTRRQLAEVSGERTGPQKALTP